MKRDLLELMRENLSLLKQLGVVDDENRLVPGIALRSGGGPDLVLVSTPYDGQFRMSHPQTAERSGFEALIEISEDRAHLLSSESGDLDQPAMDDRELNHWLLDLVHQEYSEAEIPRTKRWTEEVHRFPAEECGGLGAVSILMRPISGRGAELVVQIGSRQLPIPFVAVSKFLTRAFKESQAGRIQSLGTQDALAAMGLQYLEVTEDAV